MRVPVKQRVSRSSPASSASTRTKNKRRVSSDGAPPVKSKKRKLPVMSDAPVDASASTSAPMAGVVVVVPKRKPIKKAATKKGVAEVAAPKVAVKKQKVVKVVDVKLASPAKGKVSVKKVAVVAEKKVVGVKTAAKKVNRKLSTASVDGNVEVVKDVPTSEKPVLDLPIVVPKKSSKKAAKGPAGDGKAKVAKLKVKPEDVAAPNAVVVAVATTAGQVAKKKPAKTERKVGVKKVTEAKRPKATSDGNKKRRKSTSVTDGVGADESTSEPSASMFANSPFDVIDEVARNTTTVVVAVATVAQKKTKENEEKESSSAIKNKIVGSKNKKQLTKKTPKIVDEVAGKKVDGVLNEISDVAMTPTAITEAGEKLETNLPDKDLLDKANKSKIVIKKSLKEKKPQVNIIKKKVMFKKTTTKAVKGAKVTFKVKESEQQSSKKKRPPKKGKKSSDGQQVAGGTSFQDDYNSSTSDDCTLDLLLRRQKQLKQEELNAAAATATTTTPTPKSSGVEVKPVLATSVKADTTPVVVPTVSAATKSKIKMKIVAKNEPANVKKHVKKPFVSKSKSQPTVVAKKSSSTLNKLKLAAARKKAIVSKVKRMRSNEVSKLGSGSESEQRARRMKLFGFWSGPKRHRVASLNALAKVHCLYENESRGALMSVCAKPASPGDSSGVEEKPDVKTETVNTRTLRSGPGRRGIGQHWDQQTTSSSSSSEDNGHHSDSSLTPVVLDLQPSYKQKQMKAKAAKPVKKVSKPRRHEAVMDLKDMVVRKRMASLNASAILSASYSPIEKLQKKQRSVKDEDSPIQVDNDDDSHVRKKKCKKKILVSNKLIEGEGTDEEARSIIELATSNNKKVATVIVNQDTDVTITGVYVNSTTHRSSTTHEGYCSIAGMQYLISSTSHTKTEARAVATEVLHAPTELVPPGPTLHPPEPPLQPPMKSYTPLGALSIMQPPGGPMSPLARRHGCASAFSAPPLPPPVPPPVPTSHHHHHHVPAIQEQQQAPPPPPAPYLHGYYQPAGPLISAHHHQHSLPKASVLPTLEASPTSTPPTNTPSAPPPISASTSSGTRGGDESSDNDVVITASSCHNPTYPAGPPSQSAPTYRYQTYALAPTPQHHQYGYPSQYPAPQYYPVAAGQGGGYAPAPGHYHNPELCYTTTNYPPAPQYYHKTYSTPPPVTYPRRYGPPPPPHPAQYYPAELYPPPPEQQAGRQMVATASTSYQQPPPGDAYPHPQQAPPPVVPMVESYPPPPAPGYYPAYPPPAPPPCYSHSPPARSLAYIDPAYQGCPCPMQSCPKNVNTGPLTGEGKGPRPSAAYIHHLPLPPVALALPSEPPHAGGPPSPARGSAGMHPTPSPCLATAQGSDAVAFHPAKREQATSESRAVSAEPSSLDNHVGLLTIHKPQGEPKATVLEAGSAASVGTVHVGKDLTLTRCNGARPGGLDRVEAKLEKTVKLEVLGSGDDDVKAAAGNVRKRKMKTECATAPKPKKRNVAAAKRPAAKSRLASPGKETESKAASLKAKCNNQPLSSANSCSLHNSKQNAKKRKLSNVEELAENQEPTPLASPAATKSGKLAAKAKSKEPKPPNRPRLCPPSQETKARNVKVSKKTVAVTEERVEPLVCDLTATTLGSNGVVVPAKSAAKSGQKIVPKAAPVRRRLTKCQLKVVDNVDETILDVVKMAVDGISRKLAPKSKLGKLQNVPNCVLADVGKVKNRRKTDSDVSKTSHMLRSHGIQNVWEPLPPAKLSPPTTTGKGKAAAAARKQARKKIAPSTEICNLALMPRRHSLKPRWSNGWCWEGDSFHGKVFLNSECTSVDRVCYPSMRHVEGDLIRLRDCVLLRSGGRRNELPYIAKVAQLWENPDDGEMMVTMLWYYRPEHTDQGRRGEDMFDEVFASKHKDANSVACIEDKCYVLTFNEYCRYRAGSQRQQDAGRDLSAVVPLPPEYPRANRQPSSSVSPDMVFFCRHVYDFRQKRILKNPC